MTSNLKTNTSFTVTTFWAYEAKVVLFFRLEDVFLLKTAPEKGQLWQPSAAPVFDQMASDKVHSGLKHVLYHLWEREGDLKKLTRPTVDQNWGFDSRNRSFCDVVALIAYNFNCQ